jgi:hypothetical protein
VRDRFYTVLDDNLAMPFQTVVRTVGGPAAAASSLRVVSIR